MTTPAPVPALDVDRDAWRAKLARLHSPDVVHALVVQCALHWLDPAQYAFRNEIDQALMTAQLHRGDTLTVTRVILHNLPAATDTAPRPPHFEAAFDEWHYRLAASAALLFPTDRPAPRIHRLIIRGDQTEPPIPDMVEFLENGHWTDRQRAGLALHIANTTGNTTPLTSYDVDLDGPFGDADPSVHM
ncbi:hypothetical protein ACFQVC_13100 [Streptomyces monticola]|uniref:Uncharacterized protein n=1 Tax=Streptomyces monticola TaxID=2666263 RepID=A0ABW2JI83_9ACTN